MVRMERHKCKLCSRSFSSGRALGGHMRSHLATLPLPPKTPQKLQEQRQPPVAGAAVFGGGGGESAVSSTSDECCSGEEKGNINFGFSTNEDQKGDDLVYGYGLRKNPKKSLVAVHEGESEAESTKKPTRRRSKRSRRTTAVNSTESMAMAAELEQVSSVSNITNNSPDEDLAMCLIMLSRDVWNTPTTTTNSIVSDEYCSEKKPMNIKSEKICKNKNKNKKKMKIDCWEEEDIDNVNVDEELEEVPRNVVCRRKPKFLEDKKVHDCPFCGKVFGSGQALGGHKRSHFLGSTTTTATATITTTGSVSVSVSLSVSNSANKFQHGGGGGGGVFLIDLNLPAPMEEEDEDVHDHHHQQQVSAVS